MRRRYLAEWAAGGLRLEEPTLREVRKHAPALAGFYNEPVNRALLTNDTELSPEDVVEQFEEMWEDGGRPFLLYRAGDMVGDCDFRNVEDGHAEFAILVGPRDTQAKGLGTRFAVMAHAVAFGPLGLARIYASVRPENRGSLRMFEKLGYAVDPSPEARQHAEAEDDVCLSIGLAELQRAQGDTLKEVIVNPR